MITTASKRRKAKARPPSSPCSLRAAGKEVCRMSEGSSFTVLPQGAVQQWWNSSFPTEQCLFWGCRSLLTMLHGLMSMSQHRREWRSGVAFGDLKGAHEKHSSVILNCSSSLTTALTVLCVYYLKWFWTQDIFSDFLIMLEITVQCCFYMESLRWGWLVANALLMVFSFICSFQLKPSKKVPEYVLLPLFWTNAFLCWKVGCFGPNLFIARFSPCLESTCCRCVVLACVLWLLFSFFLFLACMFATTGTCLGNQWQQINLQSSN